jgi:hypothetical protein
VNFDAFIAFRSSSGQENVAENSRFKRSSLQGAEHILFGIMLRYLSFGDRIQVTACSAGTTAEKAGRRTKAPAEARALFGAVEAC